MNSVLLPYQKKWLDDKASVKVCEKSRRVGLTWAEAADAAVFQSLVGFKINWNLNQISISAQVLLFNP